MAVMMGASMLKSLTDRPEMKELADDIISSQTREIEMMRSWAKVGTNIIMALNSSNYRPRTTKYT